MDSDNQNNNRNLSDMVDNQGLDNTQGNQSDNDVNKVAEKQRKLREQRIAQLRPWMYKKGQSGNPGGVPKGETLRTYTARKFRNMSAEEKEEFLEGINKIEIWNKGEPDDTLNLNVEVKPTPLLNAIRHIVSNKENIRAEEKNPSSSGGDGGGEDNSNSPSSN